MNNQVVARYGYIPDEDSFSSNRTETLVMLGTASTITYRENTIVMRGPGVDLIFWRSEIGRFEAWCCE